MLAKNTAWLLGPDAFEFVKDKPIELIEGGGLLYLLQQVGIAAKITFPEDGSKSTAPEA